MTKIIEEDEEIIEELRRHPVVLFLPFFKVFIGFLIVVIIFLVSSASIFFSVAFFIWLIFGGLYLVYYYYIWRRDAYLITEGRIVIREQKGFFSKSVSEAAYSNIVDVTHEVRGFVPTLLNFGTVRVQTASSDPLELAMIPKPQRVQTLIQDLREKYGKTNHEEMSARELVEEIEKRRKEGN